jgi:hypothetical protein
MTIVEEKHLETLYNQIEILRGEMVISQESLLESAPDFIYNSITSPIVYRAVSEYMQYKMDQAKTDIERSDLAKENFLTIISSISFSRTQNKILLNEDASEFILYYFYLINNS